MEDMLLGKWSCFLSDEMNFFGVFRRSSIADDTRYSAKSSRRSTIPLSRRRLGAGRLVSGDARGLGFKDGCGTSIGLNVSDVFESTYEFDGVLKTYEIMYCHTQNVNTSKILMGNILKNNITCWVLETF